MKKIVLTAILTILAFNLTLIAGSPMLVKKVRVTNWSNDDARTGHKLPNGETREVVTYELVDGEAYSNSLNKTEEVKSNKVEEVENIQLSKEELKNIIAEAIAKSQQTQPPQPNIQKQENQEKEAQRLLAKQQEQAKQLEEQTRIKRNKEIKEYELKQIKIRIEGARKELDDFINDTIIDRRSKVYRSEIERLGDKIKQVNNEYSERNAKE